MKNDPIYVIGPPYLRVQKDGFDEGCGAPLCKPLRGPSPVERARTKIGEGGASSPPYAVKPTD